MADPQPVVGRFFEDTADGYFQLHDTLAQVLARHGFASAWIVLTHAPIMALPDVPRHAPVPLRLPRGAAGTLRHAALIAETRGDSARLRGRATWSWLDRRPAEAVFDPNWRLAEPAFLCGIGFQAGTLEVPGFGRLTAAGPTGAFAIGDPGIAAPDRGRSGRVRAWAMDGLEILNAAAHPGGVCYGETPGPDCSSPAILVDTADSDTAAAAARLAAER
ncbi:hypothetical protein BOO69_02345 [Sulfitobacter alexandrii]|uniref:Uncharacterized protein n=1 Tax=Sulfitobacter alexandrii TaxID=1917485 RepID=A0A1J0WDZ4_9RHOB|nr:hypothetical protein [Sulfitobacter alexandrii]APE42382.1 hypothetical protein BOO69_02345 [Sulfitobacter alexandrii]